MIGLLLDRLLGVILGVKEDVILGAIRGRSLGNDDGIIVVMLAGLLLGRLLRDILGDMILGSILRRLLGSGNGNKLGFLVERVLGGVLGVLELSVFGEDMKI